MHRHQPARHRTPPIATPATEPAPVRCAADALAVIGLALREPLVHETICFTLDARGVGGIVIAVEGTPDRDDVIGVAIHVAAAAEGTQSQRLVVASVRPDASIVADDAELWRTLRGAVALWGAELVEWFVLDDRCRAFAPRALAGDPAPWPLRSAPHACPPGAADVLGVCVQLGGGYDAPPWPDTDPPDVEPARR